MGKHDSPSEAPTTMTTNTTVNMDATAVFAPIDKGNLNEIWVIIISTDMLMAKEATLATSVTHSLADQFLKYTWD